MKLFKHLSMHQIANSYIYGPDKGGDAILIDPGVIDIHMLNLIEDNDFYIKHILVTHNHHHHISALKTIKKIYDAKIYSYYSHIGDFESYSLVDNEELTLSGIKIKALHVPGHSVDSLAFLIDNLIFVGDTISTGLMGSIESKFEEEILIDSIESKILTLEDHIKVLPGHGPLSTIGTEKKLFNLYSPQASQG